VTRWNTFLEVFTGRGLDPRDRAGRILAVLLGIAINLITLAAMIDALGAPNGLTDGTLTLLIGVLTLLVGTVSGYLARTHHNPSPDNRAPVGTILTVSLGTTMVIITTSVVLLAIFDPVNRINANTVSLLTAVLGGGIGATASYLGLPRTTEEVLSTRVVVLPQEGPAPPNDQPPAPEQT
jgi:hypothetical protein